MSTHGESAAGRPGSPPAPASPPRRSVPITGFVAGHDFAGVLHGLNPRGAILATTAPLRPGSLVTLSLSDANAPVIEVVARVGEPAAPDARDLPVRFLHARCLEGAPPLQTFLERVLGVRPADVASIALLFQEGVFRFGRPVARPVPQPAADETAGRDTVPSVVGLPVVHLPTLETGAAPARGAAAARNDEPEYLVEVELDDEPTPPQGSLTEGPAPLVEQAPGTTDDGPGLDPAAEPEPEPEPDSMDAAAVAADDEPEPDYEVEVLVPGQAAIEDLVIEGALDAAFDAVFAAPPAAPPPAVAAPPAARVPPRPPRRLNAAAVIEFSDGTRQSGQAYSLAETQVYLTTAAAPRLVEGTRLLLALTAPDGFKVRLAGEVFWLAEGLDAGLVGVGVRITDWMDSASAERYAEFL